MSSNKLTANPDRDTSCANVLTFSKNEKQLLEILNMPPEMACEIAAPKEIRQDIYSIPGLSNLVHPPAEWDLFTVCRALLAGLMYRYLQDTDDIHLRVLLLVWIIKSHVLYRDYSITRALSIIRSAHIVVDLFEMLAEYGFIKTCSHFPFCRRPGQPPYSIAPVEGLQPGLVRLFLLLAHVLSLLLHQISNVFSKGIGRLIALVLAPIGGS